MDINTLSIKEFEEMVGRTASDVEVHNGSAVLVFSGLLAENGHLGADVRVHLKN